MVLERLRAAAAMIAGNPQYVRSRIIEAAAIYDDTRLLPEEPAEFVSHPVARSSRPSASDHIQEWPATFRV